MAPIEEGSSREAPRIAGAGGDVRGRLRRQARRVNVMKDLEVLSQLEALRYPVSKQDLIAVAEGCDGSQDFLEALQAVDQERFADHSEVAAALRAGPRL
jgi:Protein of unknown function (DUF2795)